MCLGLPLNQFLGAMCTDFQGERFMKTLTNGHASSNGRSDRLTTVSRGTTVSLPAWENYPTALIAAEVLFSLAQGDAPELLDDASAENLQTHYDAKHWFMDSGSEKVVTVALEALLARVDWDMISQHVQAFAQASAAE
jgi:hypothetical protein